MKLQEYLDVNEIEIKAFAPKAKLTFDGLFKILSRKRRPSEKTIKNIVKATKGKVTRMDLLAEPPLKPKGHANGK